MKSTARNVVVIGAAIADSLFPHTRPDWQSRCAWMAGSTK